MKKNSERAKNYTMYIIQGDRFKSVTRVTLVTLDSLLWMNKLLLLTIIPWGFWNPRALLLISMTIGNLVSQASHVSHVVFYAFATKRPKLGGAL